MKTLAQNLFKTAKPYGFLMFSVGGDKVHWEQMG